MRSLGKTDFVTPGLTQTLLSQNNLSPNSKAVVQHVPKQKQKYLATVYSVSLKFPSFYLFIFSLSLFSFTHSVNIFKGLVSGYTLNMKKNTQ